MGNIQIFINGEGTKQNAETIKGMIEQFAQSLDYLQNLNYQVRFSEDL